MSTVSSRYATALYEATAQTKQEMQTLETLQALAESLEQNKEATALLSSPLLTEEQKTSILVQSLGSALTDELKNLIALLAKNNRLDQIPNIVEAFKQKFSAEKGIISGDVFSAVELSDDEKLKVKKSIEKKLAAIVELKFQVKPSMIGGIEARVGSFIFEDSVQSNMQKLNDFITRRVQ